MTAAPFNPRRVRMHRERATRMGAETDFLRARVAADVAERIEAVNRQFGRTLVLGGGRAFRDAVAARPALRERVGNVIVADWTDADVIADAEHLPFADNSFDLVVSVLALHWINDLPGALIQIRRALRPDGLFIGALLGGATLSELREALLAAETEVRGGAGMRVSPFADVQDVAGLLQRAGFALPVADRDVLTVRYADPFRLFTDLRAMGETGALADAPPPLTRAILMRAVAIGIARANADGRLRATFETITATGWKPHESQQKPLRPGSAQRRLADALGATEQSAGERAGG